MSRILVVCVFSLLLVALAPAAPVPKHLMKQQPKLYYPTQIGTKWVEDDDGRLVEALVRKREQQDGAIHVTVDFTIQGKGTLWHTLVVAVSEAGVFRLAVDDHRDYPPVCWLKLSSRPGDSWDSFGFHLVAGAPEEIEVPAGKFLAIPVEMSSQPKCCGFGGSGTRWFAQGVGLIRQGNSERNSFVLKSFTPASD